MGNDKVHHVSPANRPKKTKNSSSSNNNKMDGRVGDGKKTGADFSNDNHTKKPKENEAKGRKGGGGKDGNAPVVLKMRLHDVNYGNMVKQFIKNGIAGVEDVKLDMVNNKVMVWGNAELRKKIKEKLEAMGKKVDAKKPKKEDKAKGGKGGEKEKKEGGKDGNASALIKTIKVTPVAETGKKVDQVWNPPKNSKSSNNNTITIIIENCTFIINNRDIVGHFSKDEEPKKPFVASVVAAVAACATAVAATATAVTACSIM